MPLDVVVGTQWGDEGKGRIVDLLAAHADVVARYGGGDNAGHTVTVGGQVFRLHLIPSGIVHAHPVCLLGSGMVINPARLIQEIEQLERIGLDVTPSRLRVSSAAHVVTPGHLALDAAEEGRRRAGELGTTRRGIGPAYADKASRRGLRAGAMLDPERFGVEVEDHVRAAARILEAVYDLAPPDPVEAGREYAAYAERLRGFIGGTGSLVQEALTGHKTVLAEGAQGTLLDLDHGTYPYVTSSHPTAPGALLGLGIGAAHLRRVIGVTKAFQTRVGSGPFPTEVSGPPAERLRGTGANPWDEFGTTTGRPRRCGWLDGVLLRYAVRVNGLTELAVTKLDVLSGVHPLPLCVAYHSGAERLLNLPGTPDNLETFSPEYEDLPGWTESLRPTRSWESLPQPARAYVKRIAHTAGVPVRWISVGPEREQVIEQEVIP